MNNEKAKYPRTPHTPCKWSANCTCFSVAFCTYVSYFERWLCRMIFAVTKSEPYQEPRRLPLLHPQSWPFQDPAQLHWLRLFMEAKPPEGGLNVAPAEGDEKGGGLTNGKFSELGWKESIREGSRPQSWSFSKWNAGWQTVHSIKWSSPSQRHLDSKIGPRGCTHYEFAHILETVIVYLFLAPHCQMFSEYLLLITTAFCTVNYIPNDNCLKNPETIKCKRNTPSQSAELNACFVEMFF